MKMVIFMALLIPEDQAQELLVHNYNG